MYVYIRQRNLQFKNIHYIFKYKSRKLFMNKKSDVFEIKGHNVKPIIIQLDEQQQQHKKNQSLIKNMIKNNNSKLKFSGGYKNVQPQRLNSALKKSLYRPELEQSKLKNNESAYQQLGISKVQPKYRVIDENSKQVPNDSYTVQNLQSKIQLLKKDRELRNNTILRPADQYTLANTQSRFQNVTHAQSSLDQISLQNIQAKLQAHRRRMKGVEDQYNATKGKTTPLNRYGHMKVNIDVDKQYAALQVDNDKIYELAKKRQNMQPDQVQFQQLWELKKKNDPKLAEYDLKYQQYLVSKDAKNLIGCVVKKNLYSWDKYTQHPNSRDKSKTKVPQKAEIQYSHQRSLSRQKTGNNRSLSKQKDQQIENISKYGPDGLASVKDLSDVIAKKDDRFISAYIFTQIDKNKVGLISKQQLNDYILSQQHIINGYNIDTKWLFTDLDNFQTQRKGIFNKAQLAIFLATLEKIDHPKLTLTNKSNLTSLSVMNDSMSGFNDKKPVLSSFQKNKQIFKKLFETLDFNDDQIIKRQEYIENIYIDSDCVKILDQEAIRIKPINKSITYRQIIGFILDDYEKQRNQKLKKSKQYITFNKFCQYFDVPESLDLSKIDKKQQKRKQDKSKQLQIFDLPEQYLMLLKDIFNTIPRIYQDYIVSADFVQTCLKDPQVMALSDQLCRIQSVQTKLPVQSLLSTLRRMQKQCDQYSNWDLMKTYFSRRGRPLDWDLDLINKKKQIRNQKLKQERKSISKSKLRETQNFFEYGDLLKNRSKQKLKRIPDKYTVPQPFDITDMKQKPNLSKAKEGQKQFQELKKQFKANPVNKQILEPKPELIQGKLANKKSQKQIPYKYQDYENDRIQRALKRAQQQYQIDQKIKAIKDMTQVKAAQIGIDLTKKFKEVIKQNEKMRKQKSKFKPTKPQASQNLYPKDPSKIKQQKIKKVQENIKKGEEIAKAKKELLQKQKSKLRQKNNQIKKITQQTKKREKQEQQMRDKMLTETQGLDFKPKIKKKQISAEQKERIQKQRQQRLKKQKQQMQLMLKIKQEQRKKRLAFQKKQNKLNIQGLTDQQILDKIDEVDFQDLLLDDQSKKQYAKQFDSRNKSSKQLKEKQLGLAGRQRAAMEQQQKRIMDQKRKYKQKVQKSKVQPNQNYSKVSVTGQKSAAYKNDLNFHKSKALRRYRAIMDGKKPDSQYDRYTQYNKDEEGDGNKKRILQIDEQQSLQDQQS